MSYGIEYSGEVYKVPRGIEDSGEDSYLLIITEGDNNVYEYSGKRARSTYIVEYGWNYNIIGTVCKRAGVCEGGGLQPGGKWMKPEAYLKKYRNKIKDAPLIDVFFKQGKRARFQLTELTEDWQKKQYEEYKEFVHEEIGHYSGEKELWAEVHLTDFEVFKKFTHLWSLAKYREGIVIL